MILWINGAFGAGKTTVACELCRRLPGTYLYDPENFGFFLRKNLPPQCGCPDFQDMPLWREGNYQILNQLCRQYSGVVVVPMTLANPDYEREILGRLEDGGLRVDRFLLYASREALVRRLKKRSLGRLSREKFAVESIGRCLDFFDRQTNWTSIATDNRPVEQIVEELGRRAGLDLLPDRRSGLKRAADRLAVVLKHIR